MKNTTLSDEQKKKRLGMFTGSEIYKLMGARGFGKTGETYIYEKASEIFTGQSAKQDFSSAATSWGNDHELEAMLYYESATKNKVVKGKTLNNGIICGTPDGLCERISMYTGDVDKFGIEIKCPFNPGNHMQNLLMNSQDDLLKLRPEYYWQCISYMWLTKLNKWVFCSYDPRFTDNKRMLILNLNQDENHLNLMKERVAEAKKILKNIISKINK